MEQLQYLNKLAVINGEVVEDVAHISEIIDKQAEKNNLLKTQEYIENMRKSYCSNPMLDQRPEEFPIELWTCVFDSQKILVKNRWDSYKSKCNPPERLHDVIQQILKIVYCG